MKSLGTERRLAAGATLFTAGDNSDNVYFVVEGHLEVVHQSTEGELVVGQLEAGELAGEITAVIGGQRTATVRAGAEPVTLRELTADEYATWLEGQPQEAQRLAAQARDRIDHTRVARVLTELIGPGHLDVIEDTNELLEWTRLEAGQELFRQGDIADAAYIVVAGRLQLVAESHGQITLDVSIGRGDIVGELGIIEQAPRSATARATRDVTLARLSVQAFETLTAKHPTLMLQVFRKILTRVMRPSVSTPHAGMITIAVLDPDADPDLARSLAGEIEHHGPTLYLDRAQVSQFFQRRGIVDADVGTVEHARLDEFLNEADVAHRWVVLETDPTLTPWTKRALRSADRVVLVVSSFPSEHEVQLIRAFSEVVDAVADRELWLVQSNAPSINRPTLCRSAVAASKPDRILQLHRRTPASVARTGRLISGTATGIALSGGGARGFAHIGALRALADSGVHIDVVAGTSMGAIVASSMAFVGCTDQLLDHVVTGFSLTRLIDYTVPIVSLVSGHGLTNAIDQTHGPTLIEELTLPFMCATTNLTTAELMVLRTGPVAHALRASVSLPGIFPPVVHNGDLLVDGGVLQNLPVAPLAADPAVATIIGIDVSPPNGPRATADYGRALKGSTVLRNQITGNSTRYPSLTNTIMASMLLGSAQSRTAALESGELDQYLSLNLSGVKLLDFENIPNVAERGYEATLDALATSD